MKLLFTFLTITLLFGCEENNKDKVEMQFSKDVCKKIKNKAYARTNLYFELGRQDSRKDASEFANIYNAFCKD